MYPYPSLAKTFNERSGEPLWIGLDPGTTKKQAVADILENYVRVNSAHQLNLSHRDRTELIRHLEAELRIDDYRLHPETVESLKRVLNLMFSEMGARPLMQFLRDYPN